MPTNTRGRPSIGPKVQTSIPKKWHEALLRLAEESGVTPASYARRVFGRDVKIQAEVQRYEGGKVHAIDA